MKHAVHRLACLLAVIAATGFITPVRGGAADTATSEIPLTGEKKSSWIVECGGRFAVKYDKTGAEFEVRKADPEFEEWEDCILSYPITLKEGTLYRIRYRIDAPKLSQPGFIRVFYAPKGFLPHRNSAYALYDEYAAAVASGDNEYAFVFRAPAAWPPEQQMRLSFLFGRMKSQFRFSGFTLEEYRP